jgi:hypothetical protein
MPYRNAHWWILLLFPAVGLAFWPGYFSQLGGVSWILHAHGITASLWTALVAVQSWSIHNKALPAHRVAGRASLVLFPLFWTSGLLIVQLMAAGFVVKDNPFHAMYGARLVPVDTLTSMAVLYLYYVALSRRRSVFTHSAAMLAIPLFLLPPIFGRLVLIAGPFAIRGPDQFYKFGYALDTCVGVSILISLWVWSRRRRTASPFLFAACIMLVQGLAFETLGRSAVWERAMVPLASIPTALIAAIGLAISVTVVWIGWTQGSALRSSTAGEEVAQGVIEGSATPVAG